MPAVVVVAIFGDEKRARVRLSVAAAQKTPWTSPHANTQEQSATSFMPMRAGDKSVWTGMLGRAHLRRWAKRC
jgi:hypothetical protein